MIQGHGVANRLCVEAREKLIKAIYDAGGRIMTGSDTPEFLGKWHRQQELNGWLDPSAEAMSTSFKED